MHLRVYRWLGQWMRLRMRHDTDQLFISKLDWHYNVLLHVQVLEYMYFYWKFFTSLVLFALQKPFPSHFLRVVWYKKSSVISQCMGQYLSAGMYI